MRAGKLAALAAIQCVFLASAGSASASVACPGDEQIPTVATAAQAAASLTCDINVLRDRNGLKPLRWEWRLWTAAQRQANDMAQHEFIAHAGSDGSGLLDRVTRTGYTDSAAAPFMLENIDWASAPKSSPLATAFGWMDSPAHRENMLDPDMEDLGVGVAEGAVDATGTSGVFYVVDFGTRGGELPAQAATTRPACGRAAGRRRMKHRTAKRAHRVRRKQTCRS